jgi:RimJ/RimL family protein N-acetyltransferase
MNREIIESPRLFLRDLTTDDAVFMLALLNDAGFVNNIGDRGVRTLEEAAHYIENRLAASYRLHGYGQYLCVLKQDATPIGTCGLVKRERLDDPDVGFAFLPAFRSQGYATEAAQAVVEFARRRLGMSRLNGLVAPHNLPSIQVLKKLGMTQSGILRLADEAPEVLLFSVDDVAG